MVKNKNQSPKPAKASVRKPATPAIDRDKLRAALHRLGDQYAFHMLYNVEVVDEFDKHNRAKQLSAARQIGTQPQRQALQNAGVATIRKRGAP